jgi:hypothetical protein
MFRQNRAGLPTFKGSCLTIQPYMLSKKITPIPDCEEPKDVSDVVSTALGYDFNWRTIIDQSLQKSSNGRRRCSIVPQLLSGTTGEKTSLAPSANKFEQIF